MIKPLKVLILEDSQDDALLVLRELKQGGFDPTYERVETASGMQAALERERWDLVISDYSMPQFNALAGLKLLQSTGQDIPFILISGTIGEDIAVAAMKAGADDYLIKGNLARLAPSVERELREAETRHQRKRAEAALHESELQYRAMIDSMNDAIHVVNRDLRFLLVNQTFLTWCDQLELKPPALGQSVFEAFPFLPEKIRLEYEHVFQRAKILSTEETTCFNGRQVITETRKIPIIEHGSVVRVVTVLRDITERHRIELQRAAFTALGRTLSAATTPREAADTILQTADDLIGWDACTLDLYSANDDTLHSVVNMDTVEGRRVEVPLALSGTQPTSLARKTLTHGGQIILRAPPLRFSPDAVPFGDLSRPSFSILCVPIRHGETVTGLLSIQSYKPNAYSQADLQLLQALADHCAAALHRLYVEEKTRHQASLLDLARDAIIVCDMEDRVQFWNKGAERLYGWTAPEAQGHSTAQLLYRHSAAFAVAKQALHAHDEWAGELTQITKDRREVMVNSRWTLVRDGQGQPKSVLVINTDITEEKKYEAQFLRAQRLESIGALTGGIAHDFNNILTPIMMSIPLLRRRLEAQAQESLLNSIETCAQRGADIIRQLLTFSRGTEGQRVAVNVQYLIKDMAKLAQETFPRSLSVKVNLPAGLWPVNGDPTQLHQVLMNLCVNARDAMPEGGNMLLQAKNARLDQRPVFMPSEVQPGRFVRLEVADTGQGMPPEILDRIFDPFFTTKAPGKGTGLGLFTVLGIVKGHGGFLNVRSQVGHGTVFEIFLPAAPEAAVAAQPPSPALLRRGKGELILVVDDEAQIRLIIERLLNNHGYQVLVASNGAEAIELYARHQDQIRLVITDVMMPVMDGLALTRLLKQRRPDLLILVITGLISSKVSPQPIKELQEAGASKILTKPYSPDELLTAVQQTLHESLGNMPRTP